MKQYTMHIFYTVVLSLWVGGMAMFTFVVTPIVFNSFDRDMAGRIVGELFPAYFWFNLILSALALVAIVSGWLSLAKVGYRISLGLVVLALFINVAVTFKLHPDVRAVKLAIHSFSDATADTDLLARFRKLHGVSAVLNLVVLADGLALLVISSVLKR